MNKIDLPTAFNWAIYCFKVEKVMVDDKKLFVDKRKILKAAYFSLKWLLLLVGITAVFCGILLLTGISNDEIQGRIEKNLAASIEQFKTEGNYPKVFNAADQSYRLDNYTDMIILQESLFMNTTEDPLSVFDNPFLTRSYGDEELSDQVLAFEEAVLTKDTNTHYTYYWIGIRAIVRPLLIFFNYQNIRGILSIVFCVLWFAAMQRMNQKLGSAYAIAFFSSIACFNVPVIGSQLQFAPCFLIVFIAVWLLLKFDSNKKLYAPLFFITGACTQYFDFYTYPLITLGIPLTILAALIRNLSKKERRRIIIGCVISWTFAYFMMWIVKMCLVQIFTDQNDVFLKAFVKFSDWTGGSKDSSLAKYTFPYTMELCMNTLLQPHNKLLILATLIVYAIRIFLGMIKRKLQKPVWASLYGAVFTICWIAVASQATGRHYWFQYRILAALVFSIFAFISSILPVRLKMKDNE